MKKKGRRGGGREMGNSRQYGKHKARHHHAGSFTPGNMASEPNKQNVPGLKFFFFFFLDIHISLGQYGNGHLHGLYIFIYLIFFFMLLRFHSFQDFLIEYKMCGRTLRSSSI
jgi:hypothetical protein